MYFLAIRRQNSGQILTRMTYLRRLNPIFLRCVYSEKKYNIFKSIILYAING